MFYIAYRATYQIKDIVSYHPKLSREPLDNVKWNAKRDSRKFHINQEYVQSIFANQNYLCKITGCFMDGLINQPSIDRINTRLGYIPNNIQIVLKQVNMGKSNLSDATYRDYLKLITTYNNL